MTPAAIFNLLMMSVAITISGLLALYAWLRRGKPGVGAFAVMMAFVVGWALTVGMRVLSSTYEAAQVWFNLNFLAVAVVPVLFFIFIVQYSGRAHWLNFRRIVLLLLVPAAVQVLVWTNDAHHLFVRQVVFTQVQGMMQVDLVQGGPAFIPYSIYSYGLLFSGLLLALITVLRAHDIYRRQATFLLLGAIPPIIVNIIRTFRWFPGLPDSLTPLAFTIAGLVFAWDLFRYRFLDIVPVAREALIDSMGDGMLVIDENRRVVDLNPAMRALLGAPGEGAVGRPLEVVLGERPGWLEHFASAEGPAELATVIDGETRHHDLHISPLEDRRGRRTGRLLLLRDITARKQAEQALLHTNEELRSRNDELDAFAHTVAHDLKNPLGVITLYSQSLESGLDELDRQETLSRLEVITRNGFKMASIIDELLLLASLRKEQHIRLDPLDLPAMLADVHLRLTSLIREHSAEIIEPTAFPPVLGRTQWVEEVLANYISNAIKYGGKPPVVCLGAAAQLDGMVRIWVRDNGAGLKPEEQARLFTPFTQLHQANIKGHGLGLSIVRRIVEKMGGTVGLESPGIPGEGCIFSFTLPAAPEESGTGGVSSTD